MSALVNEPRAFGQIFNIGNSEEISIRALANKIREMTGSTSELICRPYDQVFDTSFEDIPRRVPDISKLRRLVGYEPCVHLDGILESTIRYWENQLGPRSAIAALRRPRRSPQPLHGYPPAGIVA
jgi:UDP-glucose 4-epimerase